MTPEQMRAEIERLQAQVASLKADSNTTKPAGTDSESPVGNEREEAVGKTERTALSDSQSGLSQTYNTVQGVEIVETSTVLPTVSRTRADLQHELRMESAAAMCKRVAGGESLRSIAKDPDMPDASTFLRWCHDDSEIGQMYMVALRMRAALVADELIDLADRAEGASEAAEVQALKLMVNTRQWVASRLLPKQYGEKVEHEHSGQVTLDEKQIDARLAHLVGRIKGSTAR